MKVDYVNHMGDDLMVVNAARVSFDKRSHYIREQYAEDDFDFVLKESDEKLIGYLARNGHWTPFAHPQITLRMKAPVFIRTQCFKHKQGFVENEVSRRYVDEPPEFYTPEAWRGKPVNAKQGSSDTVIPIGEDLRGNNLYQFHMTYMQEYYEHLIANGVAPEQARMVLPQSMYTEWYWTGSLAAYARFYKQRSDAHAQKEIQELARMVGDIIQPLFPVSWQALTEKETHE